MWVYKYISCCAIFVLCALIKLVSQRANAPHVHRWVRGKHAKIPGFFSTYPWSLWVPCQSQRWIMGKGGDSAISISASVCLTVCLLVVARIIKQISNGWIKQLLTRFLMPPRVSPETSRTWFGWFCFIVFCGYSWVLRTLRLRVYIHAFGANSRPKSAYIASLI